MYIQRAQLPVFGSFGAEDSGDLPVGSRVLILAGASLKFRGYSDGGAETEWLDFTLPEDTEAVVNVAAGVVAGGMAVGRDVVSVGASVSFAADTQIGGEAWNVTARYAHTVLKTGGQIDVVVPHGTQVTILEVASASLPPAPPLPGTPGGTALPAGTLSALSPTWAKRAIAGIVVASLSATGGVVGSTVFAVSGRRKAAIVTGVVALAGVIAGMSVAAFAARRIPSSAT